MFFKNVNSNVKRNIAKIMVGVTAASAIMGFGMHQVYGGNETTLEDILGNLHPYGIVANELTVSTDLESNFAVNVLYVSGHTTGNAVGRMTNVGGVMYAREIRSASEKWSDEEWAQYGDLKLRSGDYLVTSEEFKRVNDGMSQIDNQYYWWQDEEGKITVNDEMSKQLTIVNDVDYLNITEEKKRVLSILNSFEIDAGKEEFTNGVIDVTDYRDGVVTINYDITNGINNNLTIKKNSGQLLIINAISAKNSANDSNMVAKYLLSVDGKEAKATLDNMEAHKVIWNFGIYKGNLTIGDNGGVFVAPNAKVTNCGTASGYLIAGSFDNSSGEWHFWNDSLNEETTAESEASDTTQKEETTKPQTTEQPQTSVQAQPSTTPQETKPQATTPEEVTTDTKEDVTTKTDEENSETIRQTEAVTEEITIDDDVPAGVETTAQTQPSTTPQAQPSTTPQETKPQATTPEEATTDTKEDVTVTTDEENPATTRQTEAVTEEITIDDDVPAGVETTVQTQPSTPSQEITTTQPSTTDEVIHITDKVPNENETTKPQDTDTDENQTSPEEIVDINDAPPLGNETTPDNDPNTPEEDSTTIYDPEDELIQLDDLTPLGAPVTGDHSRIYVYAALATLALGISILSVVLGKKKEQR